MTNQAKIVVTAEDRASAVLRQVSGGVHSGTQPLHQRQAWRRVQTSG